MPKKELTIQNYYNYIQQRLLIALKEEAGVKPKSRFFGGNFILQPFDSNRVLEMRLKNISPRNAKKVIGITETEITRYLGLPSGKDGMRVRFVSPGNDTLVIEVPKANPLWTPVTIDNIPKRANSHDHVVFGVGAGGRPIKVNYADPTNSQTGVFGTTGSGKTTLTKVMAWNVMRNEGKADVIMIDVAKAGSNYGIFRNSAALLHPPIIDNKTAYQALLWLQAEITKRGRLKGQGLQTEFKPIYVFIDEMKALFEDIEGATQIINRITSLGREFSIRMVLGTQDSKVEALGGDSALKRNLTTKFCGRIDQTGSLTALDQKGAESLTGKGDFLIKTATGMTRFTVANIEDHEIMALPQGQVRTLPFDSVDIEDVDPGHDSGFEKLKATPGPAPDEVKPHEAALAVLRPGGVRYLKKELQVGQAKAQRIQAYAEEFRAWAYANDSECLPEPTKEIINQVESGGFSWLNPGIREMKESE